MSLRPSGVWAALVLLGLGAAWPAEAPAQKAPAVDRIRATYRLDLAAFNLGELTVTANFNGSAYEMQAKGKFSLITGMLYRVSGKTQSKGEWSKRGPRPTKFTLSFESGSKKEKREMSFANGAVSDISIVPRKKQNPHRRVPVTQDQLANVLDPLTAAVLSASSNGAQGDLAVCNRTVPVFDGQQRFDLVLKPKRVDNLGEDAPSKLSGPVAVCQVKYVPIAGYRPNQAGVKFVSENEDIEVWLVRVPNTALHLPYRIVMPTAWGTGSVTLTKIKMGLGD
ncbi:MAG TPA: DUF3108 domain-containing protein [Methyloceanibacter sp.]|nr:DUF3108 domain-containing protein [Methyloceanibacter sp.]